MHDAGPWDTPRTVRDLAFDLEALRTGSDAAAAPIAGRQRWRIPLGSVALAAVLPKCWKWDAAVNATTQLGFQDDIASIEAARRG